MGGKDSKASAKALGSEQAWPVWGTENLLPLLQSSRCIYSHWRDEKTEAQEDQVDNFHLFQKIRFAGSVDGCQSVSVTTRPWLSKLWPVGSIKSSSVSVKVLSECRYSFTYCLWLLHAPLAELSGHNRNLMAWKPLSISCLALYRYSLHSVQTTTPLFSVSPFALCGSRQQS